MITRSEILMGRDTEFPLSEELEGNLARLLKAVNALRRLYKRPMHVSSGYRPGHYNKAAGGAVKSAHTVCMAVDFKDADGAIKAFCTPAILEKCGLWMEDPTRTLSWCHVDIRPRSNRIFKP